MFVKKDEFPRQGLFTEPDFELNFADIGALQLSDVIDVEEWRRKLRVAFGGASDRPRPSFDWRRWIGKRWQIPPFVPRWMQRLAPARLEFRVPTESPKVFLTFDDGPTPGVTDYVLRVLARRGARATFFLVGKNVRRYPRLAKRIVAEGHAVANHTYEHENGWRTRAHHYLRSIALTDQIIAETTGKAPTRFRPPYGRLNFAALPSIPHRIVLWDVLSKDYDPRVSAAAAIRNVVLHYRRGSIVVLHDSIKCAGKLQYLLPTLLRHFDEHGVETDVLD
ncbi:MAG: polysaccharide deacetylase family protein [Bacteroidia bacterium]|nr:polysaccharide deacetylase family protein [Bacteroidia bacterium]